VINDISKILAAHTGLPYIIVATAPSMDGYASMSSSVTLAGIKISLPSRCADVIVGDTEIIKRAPKGMILSGIGDMLAKYISICEWRIAHILVGEYYCEDIARLIREALSHTLASAEAALEGDEDAVIEIFNALIIGSVAMNYAGVSRPASGVEHYISHLYDTRGVEFGEEAAFHGIQCAIATLAAARLYEKLIRITPSRERGLQYVADFDIGSWNERLEVLLGKSAKPLIELEKKEGKYDKIKHSERLSVILDKWDEVVRTVEEEIPQAAEIEALMKKLGMPTSFGEIGMRGDLLPEIFCASKDIRDKYVLSRLLWDLGLLDEFANSLSENSFEAIKKQI
jgi:glycerol-1-phosphate dehydrogenase [NAD(P)+]